MKRFARLLVTKNRIEQIICRGFEVLDLALTAHNERERRRLDASDREHKPIVPRTTCCQRVGTREIHPDEPVRACPCECRSFQRQKVTVVAQITKRVVDTLIVECIDKDASYRLFIAEIVQNLVHEQLPLAVGVAAVHNLIRALDQPLDDRELLCRTLVYDELPLFGQDRQILRTPAFQFWIVFLRLRLPQDMTEEPRHHAVARLNPPLPLAVRIRQTRSECAPDARLFRDIEPHANTFESAQTRSTSQRIRTTDATTSTSVP